jgi:hypothetical protein
MCVYNIYYKPYPGASHPSVGELDCGYNLIAPKHPGGRQQGDLQDVRDSPDKRPF